MKPFRHYILTRFNLGIYDKQPTGWVGRINLPPEEWMQHRMNLFLSYTLPSMRGQTSQNFTWLVFLDEATPPAWKHSFESIHYPNLRLIYMDIRHEDLYKRTVAEREQGDYTYITTRIDNDDAFHVEAIQKLQNCYLENADRPQPWAAIFSYGCIYGIPSNRLYLCRHCNNPYPTLFESSRNPQTVWGRYQHNEIPDKYPVVFIEDLPYWLMVCHGQNVSNHLNPQEKIVQKPMSLHLLALFNIQPPLCTSNSGRESPNGL